MSILNNSLLLGAPAGGAGGYQISRSLRFNSADSAYLSRTPSTAGNRRTYTLSMWVKRGAVDSGDYCLFSAGPNSGTTDITWLEYSAGSLRFANRISGTDSIDVSTSSVFRDPSAWYHVLLSVDTTQASQPARLKIYINNADQPYAGTSPSQNLSTWVNATNPHFVGTLVNSLRWFPGYLADIHFIDGQALDPSSFTEVSATTGRLEPKAYTGSYGTNGFRLDFSDNSAATATTLGKDRAGSNNWTPNNLSVTAGAGNDSLVDTPTSYGTDTGAGGEVRGNYATLNPLESANTLSNGNLDVTSGSTSWKISASTVYVDTGKWYCEFALTAVQGYPQIGVYARGSTFSTTGQMGTSATGYAYNAYNGNKINSSSSASYGNSWTTGDVIGIAVDLDNGAIYFSKNGTWQNSGVPTSGSSKTGAAYSLPLSTLYTVAISAYGSDAGSFNFGQRAFSYQAPTNFKALVDTNLPTPAVAKSSTAMDILLYTGNSTARSITGLNFSPDLVWIKGRNGTPNHYWFDSVRGVGNRICSSGAFAESFEVNSLTSFNSSGFSYGNDADSGGGNVNGTTYVAWCWDAGSTTVTNTQGSITSSVRANPSAGFSIVRWTGNATNGATVGHGLNVKPHLTIYKNRTDAEPWPVISDVLLGAGNYMYLNSTQAAAGAPQVAAPTSTVLTLSSYNDANGSGDAMIAYCFAPVAGYSAMGSYVGNGSSDGVFVYTGFRPRWIMIKASSSSGNWHVLDSARDTYNAATARLFPNLNNAEQTGSTDIDFTSTGFKLRNNISGFNDSGVTHVFAAFAESPFQYARAR